MSKALEPLPFPFAIELLPEIMRLVAEGAIFYLSTSGGKDSQALDILLTQAVPHDQIVLVHASLGDMEWPGTVDHIRKTSRHALNIVSAAKSLLDMVVERGMWPSSQYRTCTSDLKRGPISKFIRADLKAKGKFLAVNCMGLRAQESVSRSKKQPLKINKELSVAGRTVMDWLPIFRMTTQQVFQTIAAAGQKSHYAYALGNKRLSCVFCIMGCQSDIVSGATHNPRLYRRYVRTEKQIGHTLFFKNGRPVPLTEITGIAA